MIQTKRCLPRTAQRHQQWLWKSAAESLGALFDRWLVFYDDRREPVTQDLIGRLCIIGLADDRVLVKKLRPSRTNGLYHLLSNTEEPILDAAVEWAARVKIMVPR